jgi:hypothetical protein
MTHPITPPPELVEEWANDSVPMNANAIGRDWEHAFATRAAQWGADRELEACCHYFARDLRESLALELRAARRPKPPSLKEQALAKLAEWENVMDIAPDSPIRRALEALPND